MQSTLSIVLVISVLKLMVHMNMITDRTIGFDDLDTETRRYLSDSEGDSPSRKQLVSFDEDGDLVLPRRISQYQFSCYYYFYSTNMEYSNLW